MEVSGAFEGSGWAEPAASLLQSSVSARTCLPADKYFFEMHIRIDLLGLGPRCLID